MKMNILPIISLINYVFAFPIFDELWQTNQSAPEANNNAIESQPKIKVEPHEEQFHERWQNKSALKRIVKVEDEPPHSPHEIPQNRNPSGTVKIKHEFEWWDEENGKFKEQLKNHVKEEDQDGQAPNTFDHNKIGDNDDYWEEDENNSAPSPDDLDQENSKKHLSDQNNSTDQDESVDEQQNESNECEKIESDQQKLKIIQKFREMKEDYTKKRKYSANEHMQIDRKISNNLGVGRTTIYKWIKELGLSQNKSKFSEFEKRKILKQFDEIKSKCKKAKLRNISINELNEKIAKKLGVCGRTIIEWKRKFGLSVSYKKFSDATKIGILKKYAKMKKKDPKMTDAVIADMLNISSRSLFNWKKQFKEEIKNL